MVPILIPAYKPDKQLTELVSNLIDRGVECIIIVNDGSGPGYQELFDQLKQYPVCKICNHAVNLGKGRAIKTGLNFALTHFNDLEGIVTADADGQHLPEDILKVQRELISHPVNMVIGSRVFDNSIPFRSRFGNETTIRVFHLLTGVRVSDTQSGLRGIPARYIPECLRLDGERYDYEINMLISCNRNEVAIREIPIRTVYIDQNRSSHFNPVLDSLKIYFVLFRFLLSSITTSLIDFIVFIVSSKLGLSILLSTITARIVAGNYNYMVNKRIVFKSQADVIFSFIKYWSLVLLLGSISYIGILGLVNYLHFNLLLSKALVETLLFFASFTIQRSLVFNSTERQK
jgi:glycosyltransferase involved in cell wall biosynthesis